MQELLRAGRSDSALGLICKEVAFGTTGITNDKHFYNRETGNVPLTFARCCGLATHCSRADLGHHCYEYLDPVTKYDCPHGTLPDGAKYEQGVHV